MAEDDDSPRLAAMECIEEARADSRLGNRAVGQVATLRLREGRSGARRNGYGIGEQRLADD